MSVLFNIFIYDSFSIMDNVSYADDTASYAENDTSNIVGDGVI